MPGQDDADTGYLSYMLRMWLRRDSEGATVWCASLEEPGSRRVESFGDISAMISFLRNRLNTDIRDPAVEPEQEE